MNEIINYPHSEHYEKSVISMIMRQGQDLDGISGISPDHFWIPTHRRIFSEILEMDKFPLDTTELTVRVMDKGILNELGGPAALMQFGNYAPTIQEFGNHLKKLNILKAKRKALQVAEDLKNACLDMEDDDSFLALTRNPMIEIGEIAQGAKKEKTKKALLREVLDAYQERCENEEAAFGMKTGFRCIDHKFGGFHKGRLVVIGGTPSAGKTLLAHQILWNIANAGTPSLNLSMEMPGKALVERNAVLAAGIPAAALFTPYEHARNQGNSRPSKGDLASVQRGLIKINDRPIHFENAQNPTVAALISTIRKWVRTEGVEIVAVDYLQKIKGDSKISTEQGLSAAINALQGLAQELDICMILLSQLNKEGGTKHAESINEGSDLTLNILKNLETGLNEGLFCRKDRHNGQGGKILPLIPEKLNLKFVEVTKEEIENQEPIIGNN